MTCTAAWTNGEMYHPKTIQEGEGVSEADGVFLFVMWGGLVACVVIYKLVVYWIDNE